MYLTKDEYLYLHTIKQKMNLDEQAEYLGSHTYTNDPRLLSLCEKYGIDMIKGNWKEQLYQKADLNKVEIVDKKDIPYYTYNSNNQLAKSISLTKNDLIQILKEIETIPNFSDNQCFQIQSVDTGLDTQIYIIDNKGLEHQITKTIDIENL